MTEYSLFEEIYLQHYSRMKRFAGQYVNAEEDAENILQDVFLAFWEKLTFFSSLDNPVGFLYTTIRHRCIDFLRRKMIEQEAVLHLREEEILTLKMNLNSLEALDPNLFFNEDLEQKIMDAVNSLPEKCREIFIMSKMEGKKQKQIAEELNISVNTVETQMGIAYKKLKMTLKDIYPVLLLLLG